MGYVNLREGNDQHPPTQVENQSKATRADANALDEPWVAWLDQGDAHLAQGKIFKKIMFRFFLGITRWWFLKYFLFSQTLGEGFQFDYIIFFRGVETTK